MVTRKVNSLAYVDDLFMAFHDETKRSLQQPFNRFTAGKIEEKTFRYGAHCFTQEQDYTVSHRR